MKNLWNLADLIDLHYFFETDEAVRQKDGESALAKRDRIIYLAKIEPQLGKADEIPPRLLIRKWLAIRRLQYSQEKGHEGAVLPGNIWRELATLARWLFFLAGLSTGAGLAASFLLYSGAAPLNVSAYLGLFVFVQLLFLAGQVLFFLFRRVRRIPMESSVLYLLFGRLLMKGLEGVRQRLQRKMSGEQRLNLAALVGGVQQRKELAVLLIWPVFIAVQLGGIGFNLGVIGTTLAKVVFSDIAFGWQSSLQLSAEAVARLVQWIALPWSWAVPHAYPNLEQIQGSQIVLKEGMAYLTTDALVAWWPFLCAAVVTYGLLPRIALCTLGLTQLRGALNQLHFAGLSIRPLLQRMAAPRVDTNGIAKMQRIEVPVVPSCRDTRSNSAPAGQGVSATPDASTWFVLIPDEIFDDCPLPTLIERLKSRTGSAPVSCLRFGTPGASEAEILAPLVGSANKAKLAGVLLLQEAWQPPLRETESFLVKLQEITGDAVLLTILLIGKPSLETLFTKVDPGQLRIWTQKMRATGIACLEVSPLVQS